MPEDRSIPGSPQDWLARAKSDLAFARLSLPDGTFYEDLCFHGPQAAEKAVKAVYQCHGWTFPYTHDLNEIVRWPTLRDALSLTPCGKERCCMSDPVQARRLLREESEH